MANDPPQFDPSRDEEIRHLLSATVRNTPSPRLARLSLRSFSAVAVVALVTAAGIGVAVDRTLPPRVSAAASSDGSTTRPASPPGDDVSFDSRVGPQSESDRSDAESLSSDGVPDFGEADSDTGMVAIVALEGQRGFATRADIDAATHYSGTGQSPPIVVWDETGTHRLGTFQLDTVTLGN